MRLAKSESLATALFREKLCGNETYIYVISEPAQLALLPEDSVRVLVVASLATIQSRFTLRLRGNLPAPVAAMLERKYGQFDNQPHDLRVNTDAASAEEAVEQILTMLGEEA